MEPIKIILAEDHSLVREGTRRILEQYPDLVVVAEADNGKRALELVGQFHPDVVISDIRMPLLNGIDLVREIRKQYPETKVLILTAHDDDDYILALMDAGASGYMMKTAHADELVDAVRAVHQGETVMHPTVAAKVARLWASYHHPADRKDSEQLTAREKEVLTLAARGLRNKAIADRLAISVRTVEGHFNGIFNKLGVSSRTEAVLYALSKRLVVLEEEK